MSRPPTDDIHSLDLALAAELQSALLPNSCPEDCPHQVSAARNRMCGNVGGDFYSFIRANQDQVVIIIGDVVGHGVRAALVMARILGYLQSRGEAITRPREIMVMLNRMLLDLGNRTANVLPCSVFYTVIDAPTGTGFFVNAGHPRPLICSKTKCSSLAASPRGMLLGVEEFEPTEGCHYFEPGERLVLYTDGILDAENANEERFGRDRLRSVVRGNAGESPDHCADAVFAAIEDFRGNQPQSDDETIVVVDRI